MAQDERAPSWLTDVAMQSSGAKGILWQLGKDRGGTRAHENDLRTDLSAILGDVLDALAEVRSLTQRTASGQGCLCSQIRPVSTDTA